MKNMLLNKYTFLISRLIIALVFIFASASKLSNPEEFAVAISNYKVLPLFSINIIAITLPWIEFVIGLFLLFGISVRESAIVSSILMLVFIFMVGLALIRGLDINCGCFGTFEAQQVGITKLLENVILLLLGIHLILFYDDKKDNFKLTTIL